MNDNSELCSFMSSNYSIDIYKSPINKKCVNYELDINTTINITQIEAYNGCVKEKVIQRKYFNINDDKYNHGYTGNNKTEKICIDIPQGVLNNEIITIPKKGNILHNNYDNILGNLYINVIINDKFYLYEVFEFFNIDIKANISKYNIYESDHYIKQENDIVLNKTITLNEALGGYKFIIPHINGKLYEIISKPHTVVSPSYKTTIMTAGFNRNNRIGNLIINYNILFPTDLTQIKHINKTL
jgi:DnaJ-class molecular chaperone